MKRVLDGTPGHIKNPSQTSPKKEFWGFYSKWLWIEPQPIRKNPFGPCISKRSVLCCLLSEKHLLYTHTLSYTLRHTHAHALTELWSDGGRQQRSRRRYDLVAVTSLMGKHVRDGLAANVFANIFHPTQSVYGEGGTRGRRRRGHPFLRDNFLLLFCD